TAWTVSSSRSLLCMCSLSNLQRRFNRLDTRFQCLLLHRSQRHPHQVGEDPSLGDRIKIGVGHQALNLGGQQAPHVGGGLHLYSVTTRSTCRGHVWTLHGVDPSTASGVSI